MPEPVNVALAQTTSTDDFAANVAYAESLVAQAAGAGAELIAFPEVVFLVAGRRRKLECAESLDGPTLSRFRALAAAHRIMVLVGSLHERIEGAEARVYNTSVLIGADGALLAAYRKRKLFRSRPAGAAHPRERHHPRRVRTRRRWSRRRSGGSGSPSASICASPSCTRTWRAEARS